MTLVWDSYPNGGTELLAMLALADWSDDEGRCFPSIKSIAKKIRLKERQVQRTVNQLINEGFVTILSNKFGGAPGSSRRYQIVINSLTGVVYDTPKSKTGVVKDADGCHVTPYTGVIGDTLTIIEPPITVTSKFDEFWSAYPKKQAKKPAKLCFDKINPDDGLLNRMLRGLNQQKESKAWLKNDGEFIPLPASWLNDRRWEDELHNLSVKNDVENTFAGAI